MTPPAGVHSTPPEAAVAQLLTPVLELKADWVGLLGAVGGDSLPLQPFSKFSSTTVHPTELPCENWLIKHLRKKQGVKKLHAVTGTS